MGAAVASLRAGRLEKGGPGESLIRSWARGSPGRQGTSPGTCGWGRRGSFTRCWDLGWETQAGKGTTGLPQGGKRQDRAGQGGGGMGLEGAPGGNP